MYRETEMDVCIYGNYPRALQDIAPFGVPAHKAAPVERSSQWIIDCGPLVVAEGVHSALWWRWRGSTGEGP